MAFGTKADRPALADVVDLDRYPLHDRHHPDYRRLVDDCRAAMEEDGCHSIAAVFRPHAIAECAAMVEGVADQTHRPTAVGSIYGQAFDKTWPEGHPRRHPAVRRGGFICSDVLDPASALWTFFDAPEVTRFMEDAFDTAPLYQYADPISNMAINAMWNGDEFGWHFDSNEMTVSVMLQQPDGGGVFEYVPHIRTPKDENYGAVAKVLQGDRTGVKTLTLNPGDIQLFRGRYTLHRVAPVVGPAARFVALPSWSSQPNQVGPVDRMLKSYGRALPIHYERAGVSPDSLTQ